MHPLLKGKKQIAKYFVSILIFIPQNQSDKEMRPEYKN